MTDRKERTYTVDNKNHFWVDVLAQGRSRIRIWDWSSFSTSCIEATTQTTTNCSCTRPWSWRKTLKGRKFRTASTFFGISDFFKKFKLIGYICANLTFRIYSARNILTPEPNRWFETKSNTCSPSLDFRRDLHLRHRLHFFQRLPTKTQSGSFCLTLPSLFIYTKRCRLLNSQRVCSSALEKTIHKSVKLYKVSIFTYNFFTNKTNNSVHRFLVCVLLRGQFYVCYGIEPSQRPKF